MISFFNQRVQGLIFFSKLFFCPWTKWVKENPPDKFFKLNALGRRDFLCGGDKILDPTMFSQGEGDYVDPWSNFLWGEMD